MYRADDLLQQAALLDEAAVLPTWEWLTEEYEAWVGKEQLRLYSVNAS